MLHYRDCCWGYLFNCNCVLLHLFYANDYGSGKKRLKILIALTKYRKVKKKNIYSLVAR